MWAFDGEAMSRQLVRALRGKRSQTALSRRLGYRSNVVYMWESGRRAPSASELFRIVRRSRRDPREAWARFRVDVDRVDLCTPAGIAQLLQELRGDARISEVAARIGVSRFSASRWLRGHSEPRLPELLLLIEALTFRVVDFVAALVPPASVPVVASRWAELEARRSVAFEHPWSHALLRAVETDAYREQRSHRPGWLARRLGIDRTEEARSIEALETAGLLRWDGARYVTEPEVVDTAMASEDERRRLKLHWADVGRDKLSTGGEGLFSWSVFALSREDYAHLQALHVRYMSALRQLVDASEPSEVVAAVNVQLFPLA
jgi:DNA-binding transcriptional regulator YiaG